MTVARWKDWKVNTPVTLTPAYAAWFKAQTGTPPPHAAFEGWHIEATWDSGSEISRTIRRMLGRPDEPGELWCGLVCVSNDWRNGMCLNVPARFVQAAKVGRSEGRAA